MVSEALREFGVRELPAQSQIVNVLAFAGRTQSSSCSAPRLTGPSTVRSPGRLEAGAARLASHSHLTNGCDFDVFSAI